MRAVSILAGATILAIGAPQVFAQDVERYQLERTDNGYVRLDTVTGRMSICEERGGQLVCKMALEEQEAYDREYEGLRRKIDALEGRIAALEAGGQADRLPSDEEFEQTMGYMEKFFRRFMGIAKDLERDFGGDKGQPEADRT